MTNSSTEARVWVGSLAAYNAGRLVGAWIDLDGKDADDVAEEAREAMRPMIAGWMGEAEAFDELWVMDHEGIGELVNGECGIAEAVAAAEVMAIVHENALADEFSAYVANIGRQYIDIATVEDDFRSAYLGTFSSVEEYAEQYADETGMLDPIPENLRGYFDFRAFGRDLVLGGDIWYDEASGAVFSNI